MDPMMMQTGQLPPELQAQAMALNRRQMLTQMLMQRSQQPIGVPQNKGRLESAISPLAPLAQVAQALMAGKMAQQGDQDQAQFGKDYNSSLAQAIRNYDTTRMGQPAQPGAPAHGPIEGAASPSAQTPPSAAVPGDQRGAVIQAMTSGFPALQEIGKMDLTALNKNALTPENMLQNAEKYDPKSFTEAMTAYRMGDPGWQSKLVAKPGVHVVDGQIVETPVGGQPKVTGDFSAQFDKNPDGSPKITMIKGADGQMEPYQRSLKDGKLYKLDNAPKQTVTVQGQKFRSKWEDEQAGLVAGSLKGSAEAAKQATGDLNLLKTAINTYNQGINTGSFVDARTAIGKAAETAGIVSPDPKVSNTDYFAKTMAQRILQHTKDLRPMSDSDVNLLKDLLAGKDMTDSSLRRLLELGVDSAQQIIAGHNASVGKAVGLEGTVPGFQDFMTVNGPKDMPTLSPVQVKKVAPQGVEGQPMPPPDLKGYHIEVDANGNKAWVSPDRKHHREIP